MTRSEATQQQPNKLVEEGQESSISKGDLSRVYRNMGISARTDGEYTTFAVGFADDEGETGVGTSRNGQKALAYALIDMAEKMLVVAQLPIWKLFDVWDLALFDEVRLDGRKVVARPCLVPDPSGQFQYRELPEAERGPFVAQGILSPEITEEQFWAQVVDAESK